MALLTNWLNDSEGVCLTFLTSRRELSGLLCIDSCFSDSTVSVFITKGILATIELTLIFSSSTGCSFDTEFLLRVTWVTGIFLAGSSFYFSIRLFGEVFLLLLIVDDSCCSRLFTISYTIGGSPPLVNSADYFYSLTARLVVVSLTIRLSGASFS